MSLRIAVVGAGRMGRVHLRVLANLPEVEIAAVVDPVAEEATHSHVHQLLERGGIDGAIVAAPSTEHLRIVSALLEAGVPTLCEKPCGTTKADAAEALRIAAASGTPLQIGYWRRFVPSLCALRDRIATGAFGELLLIRSQQWDEQPPSAAFRAGSGGILVDMGVHEFDQIRWLSGQEIDCRAVVAARIALEAATDGDPESVEATFDLSGGGVAAVSLGRRFPPGDMCRVEVFGTAAAEECRFLSPPHSEQTFEQGIRAQDAAFADVIRGAAPRGARAADAVAALEAAEQAQAALAAQEVDA